MGKSTPKHPELSDYAAMIASAAVPILALAWGMAPGNPYGYFVFLRVVVCFGAIVFAATWSGYKRENLLVLFGAVAVLYNPFIPVRLTRDTWLLFNAVTIVLFVYGLFLWLAVVRKARKAA